MRHSGYNSSEVEVTLLLSTSIPETPSKRTPPTPAFKATNGEGVDLIVDQVSGKVTSQNLAATKIKGRIVNVGRLGGTRAEFNFDLHAARRITYVGVTFRTRTIEEIREIFDEVKKDIWSAVESRRLQLPIDRVFSFDDIGRAFEHMEANKHLGKIVVTL